ncbi:hypothetical protein LXL04_038723 [Taraxacum kok-saghyz]
MKIEEQLIDYNDKKGLFGYRVKWWEQYGDDTSELKAFAIKILGLTCSASACEGNSSTFNQVHTKSRNRLTTKIVNKLVYIMYNKKLKQKFIKKSQQKEEDVLLVEHVMSDDEWIANGNDDEKDNTEEAEVEVQEVREIVREIGASSSSWKRKGAQLNLIGEDTDDDVDFVEDDTIMRKRMMIEEIGASSSSRKTKGDQLNLIDEDNDDEVDFVEDDDHNGNEDDEFLPI